MVGMDNVMTEVGVLWNIDPPSVEYKTFLEFPFLSMYVSRLKLSQRFGNWFLQILTLFNPL
jgi:hypothetical protein